MAQQPAFNRRQYPVWSRSPSRVGSGLHEVCPDPRGFGRLSSSRASPELNSLANNLSLGDATRSQQTHIRLGAELSMSTKRTKSIHEASSLHTSGPSTRSPTRQQPSALARLVQASKQPAATAEDEATESLPEPGPTLFLQPETRRITQEQLINEVKGIYAGLDMVEKKCVEITQTRAKSANRLTNDQWQALVALHRTLLQEHHDFFLASQHPTASPALRRLAKKYAMPASMWRQSTHTFLELLRQQLPDSSEHMLAFVYIAYSMMALLMESVPSFLDTWIECLGDLARYRMAIEEADMRDREIWSSVARTWYNKAADRSPPDGRIQHCLAALSGPDLLELFRCSKSLASGLPFDNPRESILLLFGPLLETTSPYHHEFHSLIDRCRMAMEEAGLISRETWSNVTRKWRKLSTNRGPGPHWLRHQVAMFPRLGPYRQLRHLYNSPSPRDHTFWYDEMLERRMDHHGHFGDPDGMDCKLHGQRPTPSRDELPIRWRDIYHHQTSPSEKSPPDKPIVAVAPSARTDGSQILYKGMRAISKMLRSMWRFWHGLIANHLICTVNARPVEPEDAHMAVPEAPLNIWDDYGRWLMVRSPKLLIYLSLSVVVRRLARGSEHRNAINLLSALSTTILVLFQQQHDGLPWPEFALAMERVGEHGRNVFRNSATDHAAGFVTTTAFIAMCIDSALTERLGGMHRGSTVGQDTGVAPWTPDYRTNFPLSVLIALMIIPHLYNLRLWLQGRMIAGRRQLAVLVREEV